MQSLLKIRAEGMYICKNPLPERVKGRTEKFQQIFLLFVTKAIGLGERLWALFFTMIKRNVLVTVVSVSVRFPFLSSETSIF